MSFKLNDYDAFLTSLFDKNNQKVKLEDADKLQVSPQYEQLEQANNQLHNSAMMQPPSQPSSYTTAQQPSQPPSRDEMMMRQHSLPSQHPGHMNEDGPFPVDFDFGLVAPGFAYTTTNTNRSKSLSFTIGNHGEPYAQPHHHPLQHQNNLDGSGNVTEFMAEMSAEHNNGPRSVENDNYNNFNDIENSRETPNNIFMQSMNHNNNSYTSDFGPIDEQSSSVMINHDSLSPISMGNSGSPAMHSDHSSNNILGMQHSEQLMRQATSITFNNIDDRVSPKMSKQFPATAFAPTLSSSSTTKKTKKQPRKAKSISGPISGHNSGGESDLSPTLNHRHPGRPRVKSAHNVIEQRYRNKINDKFNALQNSVPSLRILAQKKERERLQMKRSNTDKYDSSDDEPIDESLVTDENIDLEGLEPARKLNKATILANSIEYIKFLELKNNKMKADHEALLNKARMMGIIIDDDLDNDEQ
ncbi:uncharacterized protein SPAPADRAFT_66688 [Spathaspora passalidarum NRRL Y-27907]|uniref:BHLH domain-containing protein n=1 Tax=Spathaspora passalidarum (strain NRRL Y-27907 / 11-Y1) TaxID=619300 RepID=G3ANS9_SPAPN|nr:uncharacterized protein SPAPADRAFT_66688 [Spathaspora passalidarum NRRL Y-27907]EGW32014.1 hypothetical protein SPAPADRAFT_66688 [Spathaspora passalidarum NRRL Y-27907]